MWIEIDHYIYIAYLVPLLFSLCVVQYIKKLIISKT